MFQSVEKVLLSVMSILAEPNEESPANVDAAVCLRERPEEFKRIAAKHVKITLEEPKEDEQKDRKPTENDKQS